MTIKDHVIGVDIGSSGPKTVVLDPEGNIVGKSSESYNGAPVDDVAEIDVEQESAATTHTIHEARKDAGIPGDRVASVTMGHHMHAPYLIDTDRKIIRPPIAWNDTRNTELMEEMTRIANLTMIVEETNNHPYQRATAMRLLWMQRNEPKLHAKINRVLLAHDYHAMGMTGNVVSERSGYSGTLLLNPKTKQISPAMLELFKVNPAWIPDLISPWQSRGTLTEDAAKLLELSTECVVGGGLPDQPAGHFGSGYKDMNAQTGTSLVGFIRALGGHLEGEGISCILDAMEQPAYLMCSQNGGEVLKWYAQTQRTDLHEQSVIMRQSEDQKQIDNEMYRLMEARARKIPAGADRLVFTPYLFGESSPYANQDLRASFIGLGPEHTIDHETRAVYEALAGYIFMDFAQTCANSGIKINTISSAGGFMNSKLMREILASATGLDLAVPIEGAYGGARANALCGQVAAGLQPDMETALSTIRFEEPTAPDAASTAIYQKMHPHYQAAAKATISICEGLAKMKQGK